MNRTVVINVVGLTPHLLGNKTPFLTQWVTSGSQASIGSVLPAVTCPVQATYLTGKMPDVHGIVGNGWYFREDCEIKFWRQSNRLVQASKIWESARLLDPAFTCANLFWWYNMYSNVDYAVTPRPMYPADGRKIPDVYTWPLDLRFSLQERYGRFPLFEFWGPRTTIRSSEWIARASMTLEAEVEPTLTLIYLPHLDYGLQRFGPEDTRISKDLQKIDGVCEELITFFESRDVQVIVLSEYGITSVQRPVALNRILREHDFISIREELGRELLDTGTCDAFAVADHQVAHIYVNDPSRLEEVRSLLEQVPGVERVLGTEEKIAAQLDHPRSGDLIAIADPDAWFTYYYWLDDEKAPDFARTVDIHRKPGYDPVELFINPELRFPNLRAGYRLLQKALGFRYLMDVIGLDPSLVRGSHGRIPDDPADGPLLASRSSELIPSESIPAVSVHDIILAHLLGQPVAPGEIPEGAKESALRTYSSG